MRAAAALLLGGGALAIARAAQAGRVDLFGDEAFYWMCSQRLDLAFTDHPPVTALLVRAGTTLLGATPLGVRLGFLVCGALLPLALFALARPLVGRRDAVLVAALSLAMPMLCVSSLLATPDGPLLLLAAATLAAFERATRTGALRWWAATGAAGALGLCTHYRFALVPVAALLYLGLTRAGRRHWRRPGPWLAGALALAGLMPALAFNLRLDFQPLAYQLHGRHAGAARGPEAWPLHLVEQALAVSPLLYLALLGAGLVALRRARAGDDRAALLACFAAAPIGLYFLTAPISDSSHDNWHWPQVGYLPLLVLVPAQLGAWRGRGRAGRAAAVLAPTLGLALLGLAQLDFSVGWPGWVPRHSFQGWSELAGEARRELPPSRLVVADNYIAGAQLAFALGAGTEVYVLDHPVNARHGRGRQLALWGRDEAALAARAREPALLVLDLDETRTRERADWEAHVRALFPGSAELRAVHAGGRAFRLGRVDVGGKPDS